MSTINFTYKLTESNIYAHFLYRINTTDAEILDKTDIVEQVKKSVQKANKYLVHKNCNILIFTDTANTISEQGVGGFSYVPDIVNIFIDPHHALGAEKIVAEYLSSALAHELYHARRNETFGHGKTLAGSLIAEGLALAFEKWIYPENIIPHLEALDKNELKEAWGNAQKELDSEEFNYQEWFRGKGSMKRFAGYALGYEIVRIYLMKNNVKNPAEIVDIDPKKVIKEFNVNLR